MSLRPGAQDRPTGGARSRGRRVLIEGVLLLTALLARWDEDRKQLLLVDGTTRPTRRDPTMNTHREPPLDFQRKRSGEDRRARRTRGTRPRRVLRRQRGWRRGRQGIPLTLLTQKPTKGPSTWVPKVVVVGEVNSLSDAPRKTQRATCSRAGRVAPVCASSAEAPRRRGPGATAFVDGATRPHGAEPCEPPAS